jgi:hypothetical protein
VPEGIEKINSETQRGLMAATKDSDNHIVMAGLRAGHPRFIEDEPPSHQVTKRIVAFLGVLVPWWFLQPAWMAGSEAGHDG